MESKKLVKRKKKASKPRTENYFEELNRPVTYILDDVKETVITENTYRRFLTKSSRPTSYLKGCSRTKESGI